MEQQKNVTSPLYGLNTDAVDSQIRQGSFTYALNAINESFDGETLQIGNEQSNTLCIDFPESYKVIGVTNIQSIDRVIYMLANPKTNHSMIGYTDNNECKFNILLDDRISKIYNGVTYTSDLIGFSVNHPIHKIHTKTTNCATQIYWTDNFQNMRYLDFDSLPYKEVINPDNAFKPIVLEGVVDVNKMRVMPHFSIPKVTPTEVEIGGKLVTGSYQFAICYSNSLGEAYTSYYNPSNPLGIFEQKPGQNFDVPTTKAISIKIDDLDITGLYEYFNIAVIKTINNTTSAELVGTFPITDTSYTYTYVGSSDNSIKLDIAEILERYPVYETAQGSFVVDNVIGWYGLTANERRNYQLIWNQVKVGWETYKIPYTNEEAYKNGINTALYRGYMRDEVYPLEGTFVFEDGKETDRFHIPGRMAQSFDLELVDIDNKDALITKDQCEVAEKRPKWQVYNTGFLSGKHIIADDDCYVGPYEYGENAYWESQETYPNNPTIWGQSDDPNKPYYSPFGLAGKKIRHHKLPDNLITHIHDNNTIGNKSYEHAIFPIGFKIDAASLQTAINSSNLPEDIKKKIVGFKIYRGNRANNKSIIAKGLLNNVGEYKYKNSEYYYPNYPYNDLGDDPFFAKSEPKHHAGAQKDIRLNGFNSGISKSRFTFHSPDTSFYQPSISNNGLVLKTETIEYGNSYGKFLQLRDNAQYKFSTQDVVAIAGSIALMFAIDGLDGKPKIKTIDGAAVFKNSMDIMERLIPYYNYGAYYTSVGLYNKYEPVKNTGYKQRNIQFTKYLNDGINAVENGKNLNNYRRESSVYLNTEEDLLFPHEYNSTKIPEDNSRFLPSEGTASTTPASNSITVEQFWNLVHPLLASIGYNFDTFTHSVTKDTLTQVSNDFIAKIQPILGQFSTPVQAAILGIVGVLFDDEYWDLFQAYDGGPKNYFSKIFEILRDTTTFAEVSTWVSYESICENYNQINPTYPSADDLDLFTVYSYTYVDDDNSSKKQPYAKCKAYLKWIALKSLIFASGIYNLSLEQSTTPPAVTNNNGSVSTDKDESHKILNKEYEADIAGYYGSIKRIAPDQWGRVYSYSIVDTGYFQKLKHNDQYITDFPAVFGGDIYINRFAYKSKLSVFNKTTVSQKDNADINLKKEGNLGYPIFWISTEPMTENLGMSASDVANVFKSVGKIDWGIIAATAATQIGNTIAAIGTGLLVAGVGAAAATGGASLALAAVGLGLAIGGALISLAGNVFNIFKKGKKAIEYAKYYIKFVKAVVEGLGVKDINLDQRTVSGLLQKGLIYQYIYGVPYFFVESEVNCDYRQALNDTDGNFYPNTGGFIPEDWTQEANVPIINDNVYVYNQSYSKQNDLFKDVIPHLREDYDPAKKCYTDFPNRAIWADKASQEETKNHWLVYRPAARFDLPKENGPLTSIDALENNQLLVRFENKTQLYNALTTVEISSGPAAYLGNSKLFSGSLPLDLANTDIGYAGSQNVALWRTEYGHIFTNAKRGQIIHLKGGQPIDIADKGMDKWFSQWMPFTITNYDSNVTTDNAYNGAGITGVYDAFYKRLLLTKKDYDVINDCAAYNDEIGWYDKCKGIKCPDGYTLVGDRCIKIEEVQGPITYSCPEGWTLQGNKCVRTISGISTSTIPATDKTKTYNVYPKTYTTWGQFGAAIYTSINGQGLGTYALCTQKNFWLLKLRNSIALWTTPTQPVVNQWVGFETCITVPETKTYYIGLAADNLFRFKVDGNVVLSLESTTPNPYSAINAFTAQFTGLNFESKFAAPYQLFHLIPVTLTQGVHKISLEAMDLGNPGMFAAEIYNNSYAELLTAYSDTQLNILFTTKGKTTFSSPEYTCPAGYTLVPGSSPCDLPSCTKPEVITGTETIDATPNLSNYTVQVEAPAIYEPIEIDDTNYFRNKSWTLSYSFLTESWTSWHSYTPNYYIGYMNYFQTGQNKLESLWNHNQTYTSFHNYYGQQFPYIIEYPFFYEGSTDSILQSVKEYCTSRKYLDFTTWYEPDEVIYFNKAIVYNNQGNSGLRILKPRDKNNLSTYQNRITYNTDSIEIPVTKKDNNFMYNDIWNVVTDISKPMFITSTDFRLANKDLNQSNMNYNQFTYKKAPLRAHMSRVRHILDDKSEYKLINKFIIEETKQSYS